MPKNRLNAAGCMSENGRAIVIPAKGMIMLT